MESQSLNFEEIKLAIFDFDGTMLSSASAWNDVYKRYCIINKYNFNTELNYGYQKSNFIVWLNNIRNFHSINHKTSELYKIFNAIASDIYKHIPSKKGLNELLGYLNKKYIPIIIISGEESDLLRIWLKTNNIKYNKIIQDKIDIRSQQSFYIELAKTFKCECRQILYFDDSFRHCKVTNNIGIVTIGINDNHNEDRQKQMLSVSSKYIDDYFEVL